MVVVFSDRTSVFSSALVVSLLLLVIHLEVFLTVRISVFPEPHILPHRSMCGHDTIESALLVPCRDDRVSN